jgi:hypothetical protein
MRPQVGEGTGVSRLLLFFLMAFLRELVVIIHNI